MPGQHALLSPSGASRWLTCTPSARLEATFPSSTSSAADEGTLAHRLSELLLLNHLKRITAVEFKAEMKKVKHNQYYSKEMENHAYDYVDFILEKYNARPGATVFIEERIDLTKFVPEGFGTVDNVLIDEGLLDMTDLKYGKGVLVEAHENKQLMLYALGALQKYRLMYEIDRISMTIYQPRLNNYSTYEISAADLETWGVETVLLKARQAFDGQGEYVAGSHCKFCKARHQCKALANFNMELAKFAFEDPNKLSDNDMKEILEKAASFKTWLSDITTYALNEAVTNGKKWPGFKLVRGRANRVYVDPAKIMEALAKAKIEASLYTKPAALVGIGELERNVGKNEVAKLVGNLIIKPEGAATLVPEWDKRPELNGAEAAKTAFDQIPEETE